MKTYTMEVDDYTRPLLLFALTEQYDRVDQELQALRRVVYRHDDAGREEIPVSMVEMSVEQLREQIDPWISLRDHYRGLIEQVNNLGVGT